PWPRTASPSLAPRLPATSWRPSSPATSPRARDDGSALPPTERSGRDVGRVARLRRQSGAVPIERNVLVAAGRAAFGIGDPIKRVPNRHGIAGLRRDRDRGARLRQIGADVAPIDEEKRVLGRFAVDQR